MIEALETRTFCSATIAGASPVPQTVSPADNHVHARVLLQRKVLVRQFGTNKTLANAIVTGIWKDGKNTGHLIGGKTDSHGYLIIRGPAARFWTYTATKSGYKTTTVTYSGPSNSGPVHTNDIAMKAL